MAWANQQILAKLQELPNDVLAFYLVDPDFTVGEIVSHIVNGADWYAYCLAGHPLHEVSRATTMTEVATFAVELARLDALIMAEAEHDDEMLTIRFEEFEERNLRSTIIAQAVHHASEHRAQLVAALDARGHRDINLDAYDVWAYEASTRSNGAAPANRAVSEAN